MEPDARNPPYRRIADEIRRRIAAGELKAGDRVPSTRQITRQWDVAMATATKVLTVLRQEGLVRAVPGVGTVVAGPGPAPAPSARRREPAGEVTRDRVVRAAIEVADAEGLAALTMRRVAAELGVSTMSLYRHVRDKDDLVLLMADAAFGEEELPADPPPGWRAGLELSARLHWALYRRHPWLAEVISFTRPVMMPNTMAQTEWTLRALDGLGLDPNTMLHVAVTTAGHVRGVAVGLATEDDARQRTGMTEEEWMETQDPAAILATGPFPMLSGITAHPGVDLTLDTLFEFGLRLLLDGFAALIRGRAAPE